MEEDGVGEVPVCLREGGRIGGGVKYSTTDIS